MYGYSVTDDLNYDKTFHVDWYVNQVDNVHKYQEICTIWSDTGETITKYAEEEGIVILPQRGSCILDSPDEHLAKGKNLYEVLDNWETLLSYYPTFGDYYWVKVLMEESAMAGCGEEVVSVVKAGIKKHSRLNTLI